MPRTTIYVLKLEGGNYYVGKAENPSRRYQEHVEGKGSAWTKKWKPICVERLIPGADALDEDKYTKEMMMKYGITKVRGGSYVRLELEPQEIAFLQREFRGASDQCSECGASGHFVKSCPLLEEKERNYELKKRCLVGRAPVPDPSELVQVYSAKPKKSSPSKLVQIYSSKKNTGECFRCGYKGHWASNCYAKRHVNGEMLSEGSEEDEDEEDEEDEDDEDDEDEDDEEGSESD
jgi:predicted GIY-YIG superfamily endonuclease